MDGCNDQVFFLFIPAASPGYREQSDKCTDRKSIVTISFTRFSFATVHLVQKDLDHCTGMEIVRSSLWETEVRTIGMGQHTISNGNSLSAPAVQSGASVPPPSQLQCDGGLSKQSIIGQLSFPLISRSLLSLFVRHTQHLQTPDRPEQWPSAPSLAGLNCYHLSLILTLTINCMAEHFKALDG